jgi:hypothetical protein
MNKIKKISVPKAKKTLKAFLTSEEGRISNESIAKIGLAVVSSAMVFSGVIKPDAHLAQAGCVHASHGSHGSHASHGSHGSHSNHSSHSSHGSHGSHGQW